MRLFTKLNKIPVIICTGCSFAFLLKKWTILNALANISSGNSRNQFKVVVVFRNTYVTFDICGRQTPRIAHRNVLVCSPRCVADSSRYLPALPKPQRLQDEAVKPFADKRLLEPRGNLIITQRVGLQKNGLRLDGFAGLRTLVQFFMHVPECQHSGWLRLLKV